MHEQTDQSIEAVPQPTCIEKAVLDLVPVGLFAIDRGWRIVIWNRSLESWTGQPASEALGQDARRLFPSLAEPKHMARILPLFTGGPPVIFTHELNPELFVNKREGWRERSYRTVASTLQGMRGVLFTVEDWTEQATLLAESRRELAKRIEVEAQLRSALEIKEMLAREASHRVKNNLTMIVSLIGLEETRAHDSESRDRLEALEARIHSIALIHELLYKGEIGAAIGLDDYLSRLCRSLFSTLLPEGTEARLELELAPIQLSVDKTLYVGLAVVELITNAIKYAIAPRGRGLVRVSTRAIEEGWMELEVDDDGPGFSPREEREDESLGHNLLSLLAAQLGGSLEILRAPESEADDSVQAGARIVLRLPQ
jgi:PAS domain S-box-containing protein